jgi:hypothetical protein
MWRFCAISEGELFNSFQTSEFTPAVHYDYLLTPWLYNPHLGLLYDRFPLFYIICPFPPSLLFKSS